MDDMRAFYVTVAGDSDPRCVVICSNPVSECQEARYLYIFTLIAVRNARDVSFQSS